ncbi:MAG TPA: glycosyltransferase [Candidatus Acidoferrum sp.]|nr:glycosyltransferase [Candidatus Acidoferrum sp.]
MSAFAALEATAAAASSPRQDGQRTTRHSVEVVAPVPWAPPLYAGGRIQWRDVPRQEQMGGLPVHHPRYPLLPKVSMPLHARLMALGCMPLIRRLHAAQPFDLIDAHFIYPDGAAALRIGNALGIPTVVSARGSDIHFHPRFRFVRPQIRKALLGAAGRIAVCDALRDEMVRIAGASLTVRVIGNGVDLQRFFPLGRSEARQSLRIPANARALLCVASLVPVKGHELLLRAFQRVRAAIAESQLYLIGDGPLRSRLEDLAASLGLRDRVRFVGSCPNAHLRTWYSAADVTVLASSREGWPNVVLESLACGTPVVATRVWGTPEILRSPELGLLVEQTPESLAEGLQTALATRWDAAKLICYARQRDWRVVAGELQSYFQELLGSSVRKTHPVGAGP